MSIEQYPTLPDSNEVYSRDDLSPEDLQVLYLASLTDADREGAALTEDDVFEWLDNIGGDTIAVHRDDEDKINGLIVVGRALINHVKNQAGGRPIRGQATPTSETYYEHLGMDVDSNRNVDA
jgi:hypothetical protein